MWTAFYDDFCIFEVDPLKVGASNSAEAMFEMMGWAYAKEGDKAGAMSKEVMALGVVVGLNRAERAEVTITNKPSRVKAICDEIAELIKKKRYGPGQAASLRGKLVFAEAQVFGRRSRRTLKMLSMASTQHGGAGEVSEAAVTCLKALSEQLQHAKPVTVQCRGARPPVHIFTDGACEPGEKGLIVGIGMVAIDAESRRAWCMGGQVDTEVVAAWQLSASKQVIAQAELLPVPLTFKLLAEHVSHRDVVVWLDNDGARFSLITGRADNVHCDKLVEAALQLEMSLGLRVWYSRVPSKSNPADMPSRGEASKTASLFKAEELSMPDVPREWYVAAHWRRG